MNLVSQKRLDKTAFSVTALEDDDEDIDYWHSRTVDERLEALEWMRQVSYGYDPATEGLQRVLTVVPLQQD